MMGIPETGQNPNGLEHSKYRNNCKDSNVPEVKPENSDFFNNQYNYLLYTSKPNNHYNTTHYGQLHESSVNTSTYDYPMKPSEDIHSGRPPQANGQYPRAKSRTKPSPMSIMELCNNEEVHSEENAEERDIAVQIAAQALDDMRAMGVNYSDSSNSHSIASPTTSEGDYASMHEAFSTSEHFISRVSNIPLVNSALRFYEQTKANSRVVKYSVETVESSVKSICQPMIEKFEPQLGHLDEFACRQLDTLEKKYPSLMRHGNGNLKESDDIHSSTYNDDGEKSGTRRRVRRRAEVEEEEDPDSSYKHHNSSGGSDETNSSALQPIATVIQSRSRWEQYLVEASAAAGAGAAVFSEESMKALKYCLQWLQFASHNIETQIGFLRQFLLNLSQPASNSTEITVVSSTTLESIKREVVETLRKVVEVVGRYAGSCLPGEARNRVRNFILNLPGRWATVNMHSATTSPNSSPLLAPTSPAAHTSQNMSASAHKILTLATESLLMLLSVTGIFKDSVERAELWVDRLRSMGVTSSISDREDQRLLPSPVGHSDQMVDDQESQRDQMDIE
ncbi:transcriptional regulator opi1 [Basidiobolus ranarum]|uniref:Transcriptional regulator opi1 n=1 Tax=Basidiobolus ranarum TaxID=34480 RepID=A0ABR2WTM5_9FUNG